MCPYYLEQLKQQPSLLAEAVNFATVAGQYYLITSQALDGVAQKINKILNTQLNFEGTHQYMRDIQVFKQLSVDPYSKSGVFANAQSAKYYWDHATKGQKDLLTKKLNGTAQEIDWLRWKQGKFSNLIHRSKLLGEEMTNAPGVDGVTVNRFTGKTICRTSIKAAEDKKNLGTNVSDILKALKKQTLDPNDIVVGVEGTEEALKKALSRNIEKAIRNGDLEYANKLKQAQKHLKVQEYNHTKDVVRSTNRLKKKIVNGQAHSRVTFQEVSKKTCQGSVIGAVISMTTSTISQYLKYKDGEISELEAFQTVGEETLKGALVGGFTAAVSIFLPQGPLGFVAGLAVGIYLDRTFINILDEIFGKGAYIEILHSSGYVYGTALSLQESLKQIEEEEAKILSNKRRIKEKIKNIKQNFNEFDHLMKGNI